MKNQFIVDEVIITNNRIDYKYTVKGDLETVFNGKDDFFVEYTFDISDIPESVAVVPLLCNILPIAWIFNAEVYVKNCDEDFFKSINDFKNGYIKMYPNLKFQGKITSEKLERNLIRKNKGAICFFSGGVDAFNTLLCHLKENVTLLTLWGADVKLDDKGGWDNVLRHIESTSNDFGIEYITIKSNLKDFYNSNILNDRIKYIEKEWWHDFQHGIGVISYAAPISYLTHKGTVYFASSFTANDIGEYTCASDPTIDNFLKFCGSTVIHDGYEFTRQDKVHNIVQYCRKNNKKIELRVCWESTGGKNCCQCEKCYRTMLALFAEGEDPKKYGFNYTRAQLRKIKYCQDKRFSFKKYGEIQLAMKKNCSVRELPREIRWFYNINIKQLGNNLLYKLIAKIKRKIKFIFKFKI